MISYITDRSNPCRSCRGTKMEDTGHGTKTFCLDCGGSGCVSIRVEHRLPVATSEIVKNRDSVTKGELVDDLAKGWPELNP